jgi:hypothetical protein
MRRLVYSFTLLLLLGLCTSAFAVSTLDFSLGATSVSNAIDFAGGTNPLTGFQIPVLSVLGIGTPLNNGTTLPTPGYFLNFTTGGLTSGAGNTWDFSSGGTVTITNGSTTLASGSFTGNPFVTELSAAFNIVGAVGIDLKNPLLLAFFGLPNTQYTFGLNDSFSIPKAVTAPGAFSSNQVFIGGAFVNTPVVSEPASLGLLGAGLLGLGTVLRKKFRRRRSQVNA